MIGINLLPWREEKQRIRIRRMLISAFIIWVICAIAVFAIFSYYKVLQNNQDKRNEYLQIEIGKLDSQIGEINEIREKKDSLIARIEVIQNLQKERTEVVHIFDDVARILPEGVYFDSMSKDKEQVSFTGMAQSNARISSLMNRLDSSAWFVDPDLSVINAAPSEGVRLSQFDLKVSLQTKKDPEVTEEAGE